MVTKNPPKFNTLVDLLCYRALYQPNQVAFTFLGDGETESSRLTYQELDKQARAIASQLQSLNLAGERALLLYHSGLEFIAAFFGCLYASVVAVPVYPPKRNQKMSRLEAIITSSQAKVALTTKGLLANIESRFAENIELKTLHLLATDSVSIEQADLWQEMRLFKNNLAFLQYTSGSTGTPKGVMITHENLLYNEQMIQQGFGHTSETIFVGWLPLFHDMGLIGNVLQPLYLGIPSILMSPEAFLLKPLRWLAAISNYKATTSGGPNFAYELCVRKITPEQRLNLDLSSWEIAFNGSEPVRSETMEQFAATFKSCGFRKEASYPCYGMAETTLFVTGGLKASLPVICSVDGTALEKNSVIVTNSKYEDTRKIVSCGQSWLDQKIKIVNPESLISCCPNQVGEIWVSGKNVAVGYWNRELETQQSFNAYIADTGEGPFLRTGDLGFLKDDELFITGRLKDIIIIKGRNHYPQDIELSVESSHPSLRRGCGAAFSLDIKGQERLIVVQEVERSYLRKLNVNEVIGKIRSSVADEHGLQVYAVLLLKTGSIPKTSSGKIQRHACRASFLANSLDIVEDWSENPEHKIKFFHLQSEVNTMLQTVQNCKQSEERL